MRRLLPCPVCGGESFIESVTQGGLICSDCGAVSNQVEVADDEDDPALRPAFVRPHTYTHVTEEESQAKRQARVLLKVRDERSIGDILEGLQLILTHMIETLVSKGFCSKLAIVTVRDAWFTFLTRSALLSPSPGVLERRFDYGKVDGVLDKWGIPTRKGQTEIVTASMPSERRKQWSALLLMMEDRNLSPDNMIVVVESPVLIFAHDWLCGFLKITEFPLPDTVLVALLPTHIESPVARMGYEELCSHVASLFSDSTINLSKGERKSAVRRLFYKIILSDRLREDYFEANNLPLPRLLVPDLPRIDLDALLAIIIIGIRNAGGGVVPAHVLNWIARGDLPYFSAHTILQKPIDRIEYYWMSDAQNAYMLPAFCPTRSPSVSDLENLVAKIRDVVGVACKQNDCLGLMKSSVIMLGLGEEFHLLVEKLVRTNIFGMMMFGKWLVSPHPVVNRKKWDPEHTNDFDPYREVPEAFFISDLSVEEYVMVTILFGMKLVFPALHGDSPAVSEGIAPTAYEITSQRHSCLSRAKFGSLEFWDMLSDAEQSALLSFVSKERLVELRPCLVEDLRSAVRDTIPTRNEAKSNVGILKSGKLSLYVLSPPTMDMDGMFANLIRDVMRACGCEPTKDVYRIYQLLREYERRILSPSFKFT